MYRRTTQILRKIFNIDVNYFLSGAFWLLLAQGTTIGASMVGTIIFADILSETNFGLYRYIISVGAFLSAFSLTGVGQAILQTTAKGYTDFFRFSTKPTLLYSLGTTISACICALYYFLNNNHFLTIGCIIIAFLQPVSILFLNTLSYLYGTKKYRSGTYLQGLKSIFVTGASIIAIFITHNIITLIFIYFATQAMAGIFSYWFYRPHYYDENSIPEKTKLRYISFAQHTSVRNIIAGVAGRLDNLVVFQQLGASSLALFTIATLLPDQMKGAFKNLLTLLIPKYAQHDTLDALKINMRKRSWQFFAILLFVTGVTLIVTPPLYTLFFPKYPNAILYSQLLTISFPASVYLLPFSALQSQVKEAHLYRFHTYISIFQIIVTVIGTVFFGLIGAIIARIITQYFQLAIAFLLLKD